MRLMFLLTLTISFLSASFDDLTSFKADFTQKVNDGSGKAILYQGTLYAQTPFYVLWKYAEPVEKSIYIRDRELMVYEVELEQVTLSRLKDSLDFMQVLQNADKVDENHYETVYEGVRYTIMTNSQHLPESIYFLDRLENNISIDFSNQRSDVEFTNDFFQFIPPQGMDIIRQ